MGSSQAIEGDLKTFDIPAPYRETWQTDLLFSYHAKNPVTVRRNCSMASNPDSESQLRFNVRIATPPPGQAYNAGVGSTYAFNLRPGDTVEVLGPFGDFHIQNTDREMVYIGGGAGMAPLYSHRSFLFDTLKTTRKVSYWYGARSRQDLFYQDVFETLARDHDNFVFHVALSEPRPEDRWPSHVGFVHDVVHQAYLAGHADPTTLEYYLCGPPAMIQATTNMLAALKVSSENIVFDEF